MRALLITALLASAHCYGPPQQQAPAASQSQPTGLTEFCGTNCLQQKQPVVQHQQVQGVHHQQPQGVHHQQPQGVNQQQPQGVHHQQVQGVHQQQQVVPVKPIYNQQAAEPQPDYANNPFLNGAVDLKKPPPPVAVVSQQVPQQQQGSYPQQGGFPQQGGVPQQGGFPQQGGVPQQGGFPQQGGVPQQGGFPQQGGVPQQGGFPQQQKPQNPPSPPPNYASNPFLSGQVGGLSGPAPKACAFNTLCVARAMCASGVLRQEDVLQAKSQNQPCDQSRGETCCRVPDLVQQGAGNSPSLIVQQPQQPSTFNNNQPRTTQKPYTGPLNTTPHPGCAAALKCVSLEYCTAAGVISDSPVALSRDDTRVPVSECSNPETGAYGFCCRDPNYKDPWPETQEICDQGTSCEVMWKCSQERMAFPKKGCRVNSDGSTGICCRGGSQQQQQPQQQFPQTGFGQNQQVSSNFIDNKPANSFPAQQTIKPQAPRPPPPKPFVPQPVVAAQPSFPQPVVAAQPSYPQQANVIPQGVKPQPSFPAQPSYQNTSPPRPVAPQPSYPLDPAPQPVNILPETSYPQSTYRPPTNVDNRPTQTQFFQQQSPAINQFPIQAIKVPANSQIAPQPPNVNAPPRYEAPQTFPAPTSGCGVRSVSPGTPQDGESAPGEFPWQALITSNDGARLCAGAIIGESAILISATCIQGRDTSALKIEVGSWSPYSASNERQTVPVLVSAIHPKFDATTQANDLAVLVLRQSLRFGRFVGAVCLPSADELKPDGQLQQPGGSCLISSWPKPADSSSKLNRVAVRPVDSQQCEESLRSTYLGKYFQLHSSFMCAAPLDPQRDMCPVNLGGALVCPRADGRYLVIGASSWDVGCSQQQPAVMCALDIEWVNQVLQTPAQDLQQQQQQQQQQFVVAPVVAEQKPGFSQGYGR